MSNGLLITTAGAAAIAADLGGGTDLVLTHVAFGDSNGVPYDPVAAQTALVNERYRATIASVAVVSNQIIVDAIIPADTDDEDERPSHGFNVAECGLFDTNGVLIGVARLGNGYKPSPESGQAVVATFRLKLVCTNPSAISVVIDPQAQILIGRQVRPFFVAVDGWQDAPPVSPADGDTYVVGATPTGAWTGFAHRIAQWVGVWSLATVPEGHVVVNNGVAEAHDNRWLRRTASGWETARATETALGVVELATNAEALTGTDTQRAVTPAGVAEAILRKPVPVAIKAVSANSMSIPHTGTHTLTDLVETGDSRPGSSDLTAGVFTVGEGDAGIYIATLVYTPQQVGNYDLTQALIQHNSGVPSVAGSQANGELPSWVDCVWSGYLDEGDTLTFKVQQVQTSGSTARPTAPGTHCTITRVGG